VPRNILYALGTILVVFVFLLLVYLIPGIPHILDLPDKPIISGIDTFPPEKPHFPNCTYSDNITIEDLNPREESVLISTYAANFLCVIIAFISLVIASLAFMIPFMIMSTFDLQMKFHESMLINKNINYVINNQEIREDVEDISRNILNTSKIMSSQYKKIVVISISMLILIAMLFVLYRFRGDFCNLMHCIWLLIFLYLLAIIVIFFYLSFRVMLNVKKAPVPTLADLQNRILMDRLNVQYKNKTSLKENGENEAKIFKNVKLESSIKLDKINNWKENYNIEIKGLVGKKDILCYEQFLMLKLDTYSEIAYFPSEEGKLAYKWIGFRIMDLLKYADVEPKARFVIFYSVHDKPAYLSIEDIRNKKILLAYGVNNLNHSLRLVAKDKERGKWVSHINRIEVVGKIPLRFRFRKSDQLWKRDLEC